MSDSRATWTLDGAREMLREVRRLTAGAVADVDELERLRDEHLSGAEERQQIEERLRSRVSRWIREMEALRVDVKGAWLVDFDNGHGCYCWRWPEERLEYFHGYDEGFSGRCRIQ